MKTFKDLQIGDTLYLCSLDNNIQKLTVTKVRLTDTLLYLNVRFDGEDSFVSLFTLRGKCFDSESYKFPSGNILYSDKKTLKHKLKKRIEALQLDIDDIKQTIDMLDEQNFNENFHKDSHIELPSDGSFAVELATLENGAGKILSRAKEVGDISDGYHTFNQLYDYRMVYNALLINEYAKQGLYNCHKSTRHSDGELCFGGGWFVVSMTLPTGQVTNHYENKYWDLFQCEGKENADEWDGHSPEEAFIRMVKFAQQQKIKGED